METKPKYIGIDIGGTKIQIQSFDGKLNIISEKKVPTDTMHSEKGFLKELFGLIDEFFCISVKGIAIAVPGIVEKKTGVLVQAPHLPTRKNLKLKEIIYRRYKVKVCVINDINAFLEDEYSMPRLKKYKNIIAVMVGTGLGGAAIVDGKMLSGAKGFACEFGHIVIDKSGKLKTLEENTSGHYMAKYPELRKNGLRNLGIGLAGLNLIFNPEAIVLGGSVYIKHMASKKKELIKIIKQHSLDKSSPVLFDADSKSSVCRGAVKMLGVK